MRKLLLHTCCAPCVIIPAERTISDFDITCFFFNPNIHPETEYIQRLDELKNYLKLKKIKLIEQEYDVSQWFKEVKGLEDEPEGGKRCEVCFRMRLERTARYAKKNSFDAFTTVMSISPHKNAKLLNEIGNEMSQKYDIEYMEANFKKQDGFKLSVEKSKQYHLYRQDYCGCVFSKR
ncbi:hypothetical protein B6I21_04475 [candidate division KSB1 bacterium 4572_119]|nr:MAG: hypothetical protein B6I21_04475 [candidate division KSB1 bacterium 4572_119]